MWVKGQSGNPKGAPKGGNPGAGRPPDSIKALCRRLIHDKSLIPRLAKFANGERIQQVVNDEGVEIPVPANAVAQIKAVEVLLDRGYGKAEQVIDLREKDDTRPSTDVLLQTLTALRAELDSLRKGAEVAAGK